MPRPLLDRRDFVRLGALSGAGALLCGCRPSEPCPAPPPRKKVTMTKEWQQALTPQEVVDLVRAGNERFVRDERQDRDYLHDRAATASGQHPAAVILSCIDSRAPAEIILDAGIGDMFNARIAGNFVDRDLAGSMEFACAVSGAKLVLVMGHTRCGAIKGAIEGALEGAKLGNLTALLEKLTPAVRAVKNVSGPRTAKNDAFVDAVATENVRLTLQEIRRISPVLAGLEREKKIMLVGAMYKVESGEVDFLS
jgi:carbonic anhydrase